MTHQNNSNNRIRDIIHYVISYCSDKGFDRLGKILLNKVIWFIDKESYRLNCKTISGQETYVRMPEGPVVKNMDQYLDELEASGKITIEKERFYNLFRYSFTPKQNNDGRMFDVEEKKMIKAYTDYVWQLTGEETSDISHDLLWENTNNGQEIPVYAWFINHEPFSKDKDTMDWVNTAVSMYVEKNLIT